MVFSSITFLFYFLPVFFAAYFLLPFKNTVLLLASLMFYAWGEAGYTILLLLSILINYFFGLMVDRNQLNLSRQKLILFIGVAMNLLLLSYFKYFNFLFNDLLGIETETQVHLPLGISFFTFQAISYLVDVYRKEADVEKNPFDLGLYISMFPQLIAGPIVRFKTVATQIKSRVHLLSNIHKGTQVFVLGLAQKVLIANSAAVPTDQIFSMPANALTSALAWLGAFCYSIQIFFDFAGYSNMAIGLGLILGFSFPKNFNYPYAAQSITEFWQRWHISLSTWFRDYLYIPLGGNRISKSRTYVNLFMVFLLCGFWHGAAWTFIIWGVYHGIFLVLERAFLKRQLNKTWRPIRHLYTLIVVLVGWVIFRADDLSHLSYYLTSMFGMGVANPLTSQIPLELVTGVLSNSIVFALLIGGFLSMPVYPIIRVRMNQFKLHNQPVRLATSAIIFEVFCLTVLVLALSEVASGGYNPFIYFRF